MKRTPALYFMGHEFFDNFERDSSKIVESICKTSLFLLLGINLSDAYKGAQPDIGGNRLAYSLIRSFLPAPLH